MLLQSRQSDTKELLIKNDVNTIFNSLDELSKKIKRLLSDKKEIEYLHNKQNKFFNEENLNYNTLKNFLLISKKNN